MDILHSSTIILLTCSIIPIITASYLFSFCIRRLNEIDWLLQKNFIKEHYEKAYGPGSIEKTKETFLRKRDFIIPLLILTCLTGFIVHMCIGLMDNELSINMKSGFYGFLGGFLWGIHNVIRKTMSFSLLPVSIHLIWLKILVVASFGFTLPYLLSESFAPLCALLLGGIPLTESRRFMEKLLKDKPKKREIGDPNSLANLQGINGSLKAKFEDYEIETIQNLAYCNVIELFLRSNTERKVILDLVDQALLWNYLEDKSILLRVHGIRGAIELAELNHKLNSDESTEKEKGDALAVSKCIAKVLGVELDSLVNLMDEIHGDLQVILVWDLWSAIHHAE
jgi:hypothetical protein